MSIDNLWTAGEIVSIPLLGFSLLAVALIIERIVGSLTPSTRRKMAIATLAESIAAKAE